MGNKEIFALELSDSNKKAWYLITSAPNCEARVAEYLMGDRVPGIITEVFAPYLEMKKNAHFDKSLMDAYKKYVYFNAVMTKELWAFIKSSQYVKNIYTSGTQPATTPQSEIDRTKKMCGVDVSDKKENEAVRLSLESEFPIGTDVILGTGHFEGKIAVVKGFTNKAIELMLKEALIPVRISYMNDIRLTKA